MQGHAPVPPNRSIRPCSATLCPGDLTAGSIRHCVPQAQAKFRSSLIPARPAATCPQGCWRGERASTTIGKCGAETASPGETMTGICRIALLAVLAAVLPGAVAHAQDAYPTRTVRFVVPFPAGSGTDVLSRLLADQLTRKWGRAVISENVPGASGNIGALDVWRAAPDGHTLMLAPPGPIATNRFLFKEMTYDSTKWVPISWLSTVPYVVTVRSSFKGDLRELIAQAKAGKITVALPGPGGLAHLSAAHLQAIAGVKMVYIPYKGLGTAMNDIVAGHVDVMFDTLTTSLTLHREGRVRIIAVASLKRSPVLPDVPTVAESGYPGYRSTTWF